MLNAEQIEKLKLALASSGWRDVIQPMLANDGHELVKESLRLPSQRRPPYKDMDDTLATAHIRGRIAQIESVLEYFENEIRAFDHNRRLEELERQAAAAEASPGPSPAAANP